LKTQLLRNIEQQVNSLDPAISDLLSPTPLLKLFVLFSHQVIATQI